MVTASGEDLDPRTDRNLHNVLVKLSGFGTNQPICDFEQNTVYNKIVDFLLFPSLLCLNLV